MPEGVTVAGLVGGLLLLVHQDLDHLSVSRLCLIGGCLLLVVIGLIARVAFARAGVVEDD